MVPNSRFLENNVTNWTLADTRIRVEISVGVAYGSDPAEVLELLKQASADHPNVLTYPEPIVLFKDFGDNALLFETHFWLHMRTMMEGERVKSEIRCEISQRLNQAGIVIAFPQRDIHIDTAKPLEINLHQVNSRPTELQRLNANSRAA